MCQPQTLQNLLTLTEQYFQLPVYLLMNEHTCSLRKVEKLVMSVCWYIHYYQNYSQAAHINTTEPDPNYVNKELITNTNSLHCYWPCYFGPFIANTEKKTNQKREKNPPRQRWTSKLSSDKNLTLPRVWYFTASSL